MEWLAANCWWFLGVPIFLLILLTLNFFVSVGKGKSEYVALSTIALLVGTIFSIVSFIIFSFGVILSIIDYANK